MEKLRACVARGDGSSLLLPTPAAVGAYEQLFNATDFSRGTLAGAPLLSASAGASSAAAQQPTAPAPGWPVSGGGDGGGGDSLAAHAQVHEQELRAAQDAQRAALGVHLRLMELVRLAFFPLPLPAAALSAAQPGGGSGGGGGLLKTSSATLRALDLSGCSHAASVAAAGSGSGAAGSSGASGAQPAASLAAGPVPQSFLSALEACRALTHLNLSATPRLVHLAGKTLGFATALAFPALTTLVVRTRRVKPPNARVSLLCAGYG